MKLSARWSSLAAAFIALATGCAFDTAPISSQNATDAGGFAGPVTDDRSAHDAATPMISPDAGHSELASAPDAGARAVAFSADIAVQSASPAAAQVAAVDAGMPVLPPTAAADASAAPQIEDCDPIGSYGLRMVANVDWPAGTPSDNPGSGQVELYALVQVAGRDAQTHALTTSGRICGLVLPPIASSAGCSTSQFRFADTVWDQSTLPEPTFSTHYDCTATGCVMQIDPISYALGIQLDNPQAPWPAAGATPAPRFRDDDDDGVPGVTADIAALTTPAGSSNSCLSTASAAQIGTAKMVASGQQPTSMSLGLNAGLAFRVKFSAALNMATLSMAPSCRLGAVSGALQSVELRAAACVAQDGTQEPFQPSSCPDDVRSALDERLPQYRVLAAGAAPAAVRAPVPGPSSGVQAVGFPAGTPVTCGQVRDAMF